MNACRWCGRVFGRDLQYDNTDDNEYHEAHCDENPQTPWS